MSTCSFSRGGAYDVPCKETQLGCGGRCWQHCEYGRVMSNKLLALHGIGYGQSQLLQLYMKHMEEWEAHAIECHGHEDNRAKKTHSGNGAYKGQFAFTLTKSPDDDLTEEDMIKAARKIMNQKSCPVKKYAWYLEYGDPEQQLHPHIHGMYETESEGRIEAKHFKRAWKIWNEKQKLGKGFRGGYHRPVRSEEGYSDYIKKDNGKNEWYNLEN